VTGTVHIGEAAPNRPKVELHSIAPRVAPAGSTLARRHSAVGWSIALIVAAPIVIVMLFLARPIARLRNLAETARMAEPEQGSGLLESFPIAVRLSPELLPAIPPHSPLTAVVSVPTSLTRSAASSPSTAPVTAAPPPSASSPAFHGSLTVTSTPEGAQVFVNGALVGTTPLALVDVPVGSRVIRVELEGHERWSSVVRIVANAPTPVVADLRPSPVQ
jgi:hypothetical protein